MSLNLQDLKDVLLTSWCQTPQHTFTVRAVLVTKWGPTQYLVGGHKFISFLLVSSSESTSSLSHLK